MANGKGWLSCSDCIHFFSKKDAQERRCTYYKFLLPTAGKINWQHTVCSKFVVKRSHDKTLNGEVIVNESGAAYLIYRRGSPHFNTEKPQEMKPGILYGIDYNEQKLRPLLNFDEQ